MKKNYNCPVVMITAIRVKTNIAEVSSLGMSSSRTVSQGEVNTEGFLLGKDRDDSESTGWSDGLW